MSVLFFHDYIVNYFIEVIKIEIRTAKHFMYVTHTLHVGE